jgi:hypothetical protein
MDNLENIRAHIRRRDSQFLLKTYTQLALGVIASSFAPLLIVLVVEAMCWGWRARHCPWFWYFLGAALVTLPFLYRLELGAQGGLLRDLAGRFSNASFPKDEPPSFKHVGAVGEALSRERTPVTGAIEFFLLGPRLVVDALRKLRLRDLSKDADHERIVNVLSSLNQLEGGAATDRVLEPNEPPQQFSKVLAYLLFFDWIGIAGDGSKVWILTESRRELARSAT